MEDIEKWLPMTPKQGPPLPRVSGITWPVLRILITLPFELSKTINQVHGAIQKGGEGEAWRWEG